MFVLLDSNIWISYLLHDGFCRRVVQRAGPKCKILTTSYIVAEVREKLINKFHVQIQHVDELMEQMLDASETVAHVIVPAPPISDTDDKPIIASAAKAGCDFLITGDKELLALRFFSGVEIVTVREFAKRIELKLD